MKARSMIVGFLTLMTSSAHASCPAALDFSPKRLASDERVHLCEAYAGDVLLIVNTASKCGYTPQYDGLEAMHKRLGADGFAVLGFPSNDFGGQEPGTEAEVARFCRLTYGVQFPMFEKTRAAESDADPLYRELARQAGGYPQWNFHKYLVGRDGKVIASFPSSVAPDDAELVSAIGAALTAERPK